MMLSREDLALAGSILSEVALSDRWDEIQSADPAIRAAEARYNKPVEVIRANMSAEQYIELSDAQTAVISAYSDAAMLYGMHVFTVLQNVAAHPGDLSHYYQSISPENNPSEKKEGAAQ